MSIPSIHPTVNSTKVEKLCEMMHSLRGKKGDKAWLKTLGRGATKHGLGRL